MVPYRTTLLSLEATNFTQVIRLLCFRKGHGYRFH